MSYHTRRVSDILAFKALYYSGFTEEPGFWDEENSLGNEEDYQRILKEQPVAEKMSLSNLQPLFKMAMCGELTLYRQVSHKLRC